MIIEEIPFFVEFVVVGIVLGFGYGFTKLFLNHAKDKSKVRRSERKAKEANSVEDEIDKYLNNIPAITQHLEIELMNLKEKGATPEQCKSLESKLDLAKKAQQYEMPIRMFGKPVIKKILNMVDKFGV